jgi:hypothetical protein
MNQGIDSPPNAPYGYVGIVRIGDTFKMAGGMADRPLAALARVVPYQQKPTRICGDVQ